MSYQVPSNLKYTKEHEWTNLQGHEIVSVGITDFAQQSLGDIVFVELPSVGENLAKGAAFGVVESIKSVSDLYSPVTGEVVEMNQAVLDEPALCNQAPYESWMLKIKLKNSSELEDLLSDQDYSSYCDEIKS